MPQTNGSWLRGEIEALWASGQLAREPTANLVAMVHSLVHDADDEVAAVTDLYLVDRVLPDGMVLPGLITKVASARTYARRANSRSMSSMQSWRARGFAFDPAYMPASPLRKPRRPDPTDTAYVAWLWPFAAFFTELRAALAAGAKPHDPPWCYCLEEVGTMLLLSNAVEGGAVHAVLARLMTRLLQEPTKKPLDADVLASVLDHWVRRAAPLRNYKPTAGSTENGASKVYRYIRRAWFKEYQRENKRRRALVPLSTLERWERRGFPRPTTPDDVQRLRDFMEHQQKHIGDLPSQKQVALHLECSRATVQKYTPEAIRRCGVSTFSDGGATRYPRLLVETLKQCIAQGKPKPRPVRLIRREKRRQAPDNSR